MPKLWKDNTEIPWICDDHEEAFTASKGAYTLLVQQITFGVWEWQVLYKEEEIITRLPKRTDTKYRAIGSAEGIYIAHEMLYREEPLIRFFKSSINDQNKQQDNNDKQIQQKPEEAVSQA